MSAPVDSLHWRLRRLIVPPPALWLVLGLIWLPLRAGELKVDLDRAGQPNVTEPGFVGWGIADTSGSAAATRTFAVGSEAITVSFRRVGDVGTGLTTNWYKAGAQGNVVTRLANDGLTVAPTTTNGGAQVEMQITGLSPGRHTLLTYHATWDNPASFTFSPIDLSVNGALAIDDLLPPNRVAANSEAAIGYVEFTVSSVSDVTTVLFAAQTGTSSTVKNVVLSGFEFDTPNATRQARLPVPANNDEHAAVDDGALSLNWTAAPGAISHDVYFGTDPAAVAAAKRDSPLFKGNQANHSLPVSGLTNLEAYFWRVDSLDALGNVTTGNVWSFRPRHLAFPGAEGYGGFALGGRGGRVVHVTSLDDYTASETPIPGTLRHALEVETGARTVVFDIAGLITLKARLTIATSASYVTVAGHTAPGKGICIRGYPFGVSGANDVVIRHVRVRPGNIAGITLDGMGLQGANHCIIDHCSISWTIDEAFSSRSAAHITLQRTLIAEALNAAHHQNYPAGTKHGYAASIGGDIGSFHHNLLAHNYGRNWSLAGGLDSSAGTFAGRLDLRNNVVYNWGTRTTDGGAMEVNFVNNFYQPGPSTTYFFALNAQYDNFPGTQRYHFAGNVMPGHFDEASQPAGRTMTATNGGSLPTYQNWVDAPFFESHVDTQSAGDARKRVLSDVGANLPQLDRQDLRLIEETRDGTTHFAGSITGLAGLPDSQDDVGGWESYPTVSRHPKWDTDGDGLPNGWENHHGTDPASPAGDFSDTNADPDGDGYTALDDYLAWCALPRVECLRDASVAIDLSTLTRGYTKQPVHAVSAPVHGSVSLLDDGKTARFTPIAGFTGPATFAFQVTDAEGGSMAGTVAVQVDRVVGDGYEIATDVLHPNGNIFDQILLTGPDARFSADPGQVVRLSYIDLTDDIVQVEFAGPGSVSISLASASGPATPAKYNQSVAYLRGHASITVEGATEDTHLSVFTVGTVTAVNQALFKPGETYDGVADLAAIALSSPTGRFGALRCANTEFFASSGNTGIHAPGVRFAGPLNVHNVSAYFDATPVLLTAQIDTGRIGITGGAMAQPNNKPVQIGDAPAVAMLAGATSHNLAQPAQTNQARYERNGQDVTATVVVNP